MTAPLSIRTAEPDAAERIAAIHVTSWQVTYRGSMPDAYLDSLTNEQRLPMWERILASPPPLVRVWVAESGDQMMGFCSVGPSRSEANAPEDVLVLHTMYVQPGHERPGIGGALLRHAEQEMARMGATTATRWVLEGNGPARRFYEASGWMHNGTEKQDEIFGQAVREVRYRKRLTGHRPL